MTTIEDRLWKEIGERFPDEGDITGPEFEAFYESLPPALVPIVDRGLAQRSVDGWRAHPAALMHHITGDDWWLRPHVQYLSLKFRDAVLGVSPRQVWNLAPRLGKTRVLDGGEIWNLDRTVGAARSIRVTHALSLAARSSIMVQNTIAHPDIAAAVGPPPPGTAAVAKATQREWYTTAGGGMLATSMHAQVLGFGVGPADSKGMGGILGIDDPMKDWQTAHSKTQRDDVHTQYKGTFRHRLDDEECAILIVMQRLHRDDLSGRLAADALIGDGDEFEQVVLPHIAVEDDPLGREPGEPLDPLAFTEPQARKRAKALGTYVASAVEQQSPSEEVGNEILREWFKLDDDMPPAYDQTLCSWDFKLKDNESGDFVCGQAWGRTGPDLWMIDQIHGKYDHATTANAVALLSVRNPQIRTHVVEAAGSASDVLPTLVKAQPKYEVTEKMAGRLGMTETEAAAVQALRRTGMTGIVTRKPQNDKVVRARSWIAPLAEAGNIHLNPQGIWLPGYLDEMAEFPGEHDDMVDASSQACKELQTSRGGIGKGSTKTRVPQQQRPSSGKVVRPQPRRT